LVNGISINCAKFIFYLFSANKKKDIGRKHVLNDNILTLRFGVEACKIKNKVEKRFIFDEEEYKMIIDELKDQVKILRGALKKNGFNYDFIKAESILLKILKNDEFAPLEEIMRETHKIRKLNEELNVHSSDEVFSDYASISSYEPENEDENKTRNSKKKFSIENNRQQFQEENNTNDNDNNNNDNTFNYLPGSHKKRKTKVLKFVDESTNEKIIACDPEELTIKYQELERKYNDLLKLAGNKINRMESRRLTVKMETNQIFEDIKQEAVNNLNQIIETKSKEITSVNEKIEELKIQLIRKETELNKKLSEAQKENNNIRFNCKKIEIENSSLNEFILTYQSDIMLLQTKIEKKSNLVKFNFLHFKY